MKLQDLAGILVDQVHFILHNALHMKKLSKIGAAFAHFRAEIKLHANICRMFAIVQESSGFFVAVCKTWMSLYTENETTPKTIDCTTRTNSKNVKCAPLAGKVIASVF